MTHELDAARPAEIVAVPFAQIAAIAPALRMYHVVVRDAKGRALPLQITNYQHDHRGAQYDDLVFTYDFAAGEKRATFTLEAVATATPPDAPCVYARMVPERFDDIAWENDRIAHRMYGFALNSPARRRRTAARQRHRRVGEARQLSRSSIAGTPRGTISSTRTRKAKGSTSTASAARAAPAAPAYGMARSCGPPTISSMRQVLSNGPRRAAFKLNYAPLDAGAAGQVAETKQFTVDCGRNFDTVESVFDFPGNEAVVGIGISEHPAVRRFSRGGAHARSAWPLDELLGREQGRRARRRGDPRQ